MARIWKSGNRVQRYTILEELNRGGMAVSYAAKDHTGLKVFFKQYKSPSVTVPWYRAYIEYQNELKRRIEAPLCQSFCYRFIEAFEFERCYYQVFEFLDKSHSMQDILDKCRTNPNHIAPEQRLIMAKVLLAGMNAMHIGKIVHSDLKPDNIMLIRDDSIAARYRLKIIDMDFSLLIDRQAPWHGDRGYFGTPGYLSPEHLQNEVPRLASDVFTLGLMLHEVLGNAHPYRFEEEERYRQAVFAHSAKPVSLVGALAALPNARDVREVVHRCLSPIAAERPTALEVNDVLNGKPLSGSSPVGKPAPPPMRTIRPPTAPEFDVPLELVTPEPAKPEPRKTSSPARATPPAPRVTPVATEPPPPARPAKVASLSLCGPSGQEKLFNIGSPVSGKLLRNFGDDSKFYSDPQFDVERTDTGWYVVPASGTRHETLLNGKKISERRLLKEGDEIGVGSESRSIVKLPLRVRFV